MYYKNIGTLLYLDFYYMTIEYSWTKHTFYTITHMNSNVKLKKKKNN